MNFTKRSCIWLLTVLYMSICCASEDSFQAIELSKQFLDRLSTNSPIRLSEENAFLGELSLYSFAILHQAGYVNQMGKWIKKPPEYSYLCELLRMHSKELFLESRNKVIFFGGAHEGLNRQNAFLLSEFHIGVTCLQVNHAITSNFDDQSKTIVFTYRLPQRKLDFPIYVDGKAWGKSLGFEWKSKRLVLRHDVFEELISHMATINTKDEE